ncbi:MAG: OmpH family outer membrane protein [Bacteroidales bacterium]|nr:OmpH family outer membrane protein [Bacteroidales bacterium]MCF8389709.1 OmpH family outer membrane protein [Bacteroidales bacterium]
MKKLGLLFIGAIMAFSVNAQKFAFVDTEYILDRIPSYKAAQDQVDKLSAEYEKELEAMYSEVETLYKSYQNEKVLLTEEQRSQKEDAIIAKEKSIKDLQQKYFGPEGAVFQKRQELVKPIQDEVYLAVKEIALEGGYAVIFDTSSGAGILYENARYNLSDEILQKLGYQN